MMLNLGGRLTRLLFLAACGVALLYKDTAQAQHYEHQPPNAAYGDQQQPIAVEPQPVQQQQPPPVQQPQPVQQQPQPVQQQPPPVQQQPPPVQQQPPPVQQQPPPVQQQPPPVQQQPPPVQQQPPPVQQQPPPVQQQPPPVQQQPPPPVQQQPQPIQPQPVQPQPVQPQPVQPQAPPPPPPVQPQPVQPQPPPPVQPPVQPVQPPVQPQPAQPQPVQQQPVQPQPVQVQPPPPPVPPQPVQPVQPQPARAQPVQPQPVQPHPAQVEEVHHEDYVHHEEGVEHPYDLEEDPSWMDEWHNKHVFDDESVDSFDDEEEEMYDEWDTHMDDFVPDMLVNFDLGARSDEYFYQDVYEKSVLIRGGYFLAGDGEIEFTITAPNGEIVSHKTEAESLFHFQTSMAGTYSFILSNPKWIEHKWVTFAIAVGDGKEILRSEHVEDAAYHTTQLDRMVRDVQAESQYLWQRQRNNLKSVEQTLGRVFWFAVLELFALGVIWTSQVYYIKWLVSDRRLF